jgi:hypothetical protein
MILREGSSTGRGRDFGRPKPPHAGLDRRRTKPNSGRTKRSQICGRQGKTFGGILGKPLPGREFGRMGLSRRQFRYGADGLRCVFRVSFLRFSNYFETAGASRPAPTGLWNRSQCMQRFLARKKVETEQRLATRQGASLYSDFKITGGERAGRERMCGSC